MDQMEKKIIQIIDGHADEITAFAEDIYRHPEEGFYEEKTAAKVAGFLRRIGLDVHANLARTGVRADWMEQDGPNVTIIGELDAIGCKAHPMADSRSHVAHACGHHAQIAAMIGAALALADDEVKASLSGSVSFFAVPAEEYVSADKRRVLKEEGIVGFPGSGKSELVRIGAFEKTDIAMTTHVHMMPVEEDLYLGNAACNGFTAAMITMRGKAAHAAIAPWEGVNAVSMATSALSMIGLLRETFPEEEHIRIHNLIRKGGEVLNSVPDEVLIENKVRARSLDEIRRVKEKIGRAFEGAAYAFGGRVERENLQGYMPVLYRPADQVLIDAAEDLKVSYRKADCRDFNNACTDVGDLTHLMPVLNFTFNGFKGSLHGPDFEITDPDKAYLIPAKMLALSVYKLLKDGAGEAHKIIEDFQPVFTRESYVRYIEEGLE